MATVTHGGTLPDSSDKDDFYAIIDDATVTGILDADIASGAAISDSKLATITTASKVNVSSLTGQIASANIAQITTAGKVSGSALTLLGNIPSNAGVIPSANLPSGAGSVTASYDSGWFAVGLATNYTKTHDLATTKCIIQVLFSQNSSGSSVVTDTAGTNFREHNPEVSSGVTISALTDTTITIQTGGEIRIPNSTAGNDNSQNVTSGYVRVIMTSLS